MANFDQWVPEEWSGPVVQRVNQLSAVEALARREPMATDAKNVLRSAGVNVTSIAKGGTYSEDTSTNDDVTLTARKFGQAIRIADEDMKDTSGIVSIIATKQTDWATSYAKFIDNATLATSAATNGTTIPFNSVYYALTQTNSDTGYTANANLTQTGSAGVTYDNLSEAVGDYEESDYFDESATRVIAHPAFRRAMRGVKDDQNMPVFVRGQGGDAGTPDTVFGHPITWSTGCRLMGTASANPTGNPIMVICNPEYLILGIRSGPESMTAGADTGVGFLTDDALLKMRARRGFAVGHEKAFSVLEDNS